jgi:AmiR/NasT family two-component response regulator
VTAARRAEITAILAIPLDADPMGAAFTFYLGERLRSGLLGELRPLVDESSLVVANAVAFARHELVAAHLKDALESRDLIGQAKGVLMARRAISSEKAFAVLRDASQRTNRKLRDVAQDLIENGELP